MDWNQQIDVWFIYTHERTTFRFDNDWLIVRVIQYWNISKYTIYTWIHWSTIERWIVEKKKKIITTNNNNHNKQEQNEKFHPNSIRKQIEYKNDKIFIKTLFQILKESKINTLYIEIKK
jgi:hypothetical protein